MEQQQETCDAAIKKVYGDSAETTPLSTLWQDRYFILPEDQKKFRKWFRDFYG